MIQLDPYAENPFTTIDTSKNSAQEFAYANYKSMEAANNPVYAPRMVATKAVWEAVFGNLEDYDADRNSKKAFTNQLKAKRKEFIDKAVELEDLVAFKFKRTSDTYELFYPLGRNEYHYATQDTIFHLMKRMIDGTHAYPTELGAGTEAEFTTLRDDYQVIWDRQRVAKSLVAQDIPDYAFKVNDLFDELYLNMLVILAENYKNPKAMLAFFDVTIVNYVTHIKDEKIQKQSREAIELGFGAKGIMQITSKFGKTLHYYFCATADGDPSGPVNELASKVKIRIKSNGPGVPGNNYLIIMNETDLDANVEMLLV